jgi:tetratricopeptide (TPR) repeat protein
VTKHFYHSSFNPSTSDEKTLEALFVVREDLAQRILKGISESAKTGNKHQVLLVGPRGIGKTHLVSLLYHRVNQDNSLADILRIAWLPEDHYFVGYSNLLMLILKQLQKEYDLDKLEQALETVLDLNDAGKAELRLEQLLLDYLAGKTLLLIAENFNELLSALQETGQRKLRAFIQNNPVITILATTTSLNEIEERKDTFFGFFKVHRLDSFRINQAMTLLLHLAKHANNKELIEIINSSKGRARIRAVDYLAGGNPRIYVIFFDFLTCDSLDDLVQPFMKLIDSLTPYYQSYMDKLSPLQRRIIDILRQLKGAVTVKQIARQAMNTSQTISAQLGKLVKLGYVIQADSRGRFNYYEMREPLMRLCLEVKEQRGRNVELFVEFLRVWYSEEALNVYEKALAIYPDNPIMIRDYGYTAMELEGKPTSATQWERRGNYFWDMERENEALSCYCNSLQLNTRGIKTWSYLCNLLHRQGRFKLCHSMLERLTKLIPDDAELQFDLAIANGVLGEHDKACIYYELALKIEPKLEHEQITIFYAASLSVMGNHTKVLKKLKLYKKNILKQTAFWSALLRAQSLMCLERWEEGKKELDDCLSDYNITVWSGGVLIIIANLIEQTQNPQIWRRFISVWLELFSKHGYLTYLGEGLVIRIRRFAIPIITNEVANAWLTIWQELAGKYEEMQLPLRLLKAGVEYKETRDYKVLLKLAREERQLLEPWLINLFRDEPDEIDREMENLMAIVEQKWS